MRLGRAVDVGGVRALAIGARAGLSPSLRGGAGGTAVWHGRWTHPPRVRWAQPQRRVEPR